MAPRTRQQAACTELLDTRDDVVAFLKTFQNDWETLQPGPDAPMAAREAEEVTLERAALLRRRLEAAQLLGPARMNNAVSCLRESCQTVHDIFCSQAWRADEGQVSVDWVVWQEAMRATESARLNFHMAAMWVLRTPPAIESEGGLR
ncbi:hypothetical protein GCM10023335_67990 [Streptomyces siamensis]|uniref:Uncharacterized protein n=1 Tax=Streptomyces siamensis TaxID=1274986 RepID=A0ABP9JH75_9ACTN